MTSIADIEREQDRLKPILEERHLYLVIDVRLPKLDVYALGLPAIGPKHGKMDARIRVRDTGMYDTAVLQTVLESSFPIVFEMDEVDYERGLVPTLRALRIALEEGHGPQLWRAEIARTTALTVDGTAIEATSRVLEAGPSPRQKCEPEEGR